MIRTTTNTLLAVLLLSVSVMQGKKVPELFEGNLESFIAARVSADDAVGFARYYEALVNQIQKSIQEGDEARADRTYKYLYETALIDLKQNHLEWFEVIDAEIKQLRKTSAGVKDEPALLANLRRYGAYEEYCKNRTVLEAKFVPERTLAQTQETGFWSTISSYVSKISNTVAGWFGFAKDQTTV